MINDTGNERSQSDVLEKTSIDESLDETSGSCVAGSLEQSDEPTVESQQVNGAADVIPATAGETDAEQTLDATEQAEDAEAEKVAPSEQQPITKRAGDEVGSAIDDVSDVDMHATMATSKFEQNTGEGESEMHEEEKPTEQQTAIATIAAPEPFSGIEQDDALEDRSAALFSRSASPTPAPSRARSVPDESMSVQAEEAVEQTTNKAASLPRRGAKPGSPASLRVSQSVARLLDLPAGNVRRSLRQICLFVESNARPRRHHTSAALSDAKATLAPKRRVLRKKPMPRRGREIPLEPPTSDTPDDKEAAEFEAGKASNAQANKSDVELQASRASTPIQQKQRRRVTLKTNGNGIAKKRASTRTAVGFRTRSSILRHKANSQAPTVVVTTATRKQQQHGKKQPRNMKRSGGLSGVLTRHAEHKLTSSDRASSSSPPRSKKKTAVVAVRRSARVPRGEMPKLRPLACTRAHLTFNEMILLG